MNHNSPLNTTLQPKFTSRFLQALAIINGLHRPFSSSLRRRGRTIKRAADLAAAAATGSKRAWSQAVVSKVRSQAMRRVQAGRKVDVGKKCLGLPSKQRCRQSRADKLRQIVPGGEAMDFCSLLEETADYIQCLTTQVQVMQGLADSLSP